MKTEKKLSRSKLIKKLDKLFSEYIRKRDERIGCITCGKIAPWKEMQAGHYVSRSNMQYRYNEQNVNGQCVACNVFKHGNMIAYRQALVKLYGEPKVDIIERESNKPYKMANSELELLIRHYQDKLKDELLIKTYPCS